MSSPEGLSPGQRLNSRYEERDLDDRFEIKMCEEGPSDSLNNTEIKKLFNGESLDESDRNNNIKMGRNQEETK